MAQDDAAYHELSAYTIQLRDPAFIHQHVVDTYVMQTATSDDKPIRVVQALVGLYLHVEHGLTGRQVRRIHQMLGDRRPDWPHLTLPPTRGSMTVRDVLAEPAGARRDHAIEAWVRSIWEACRELGDDVESQVDPQGRVRSATISDPAGPRVRTPIERTDPIHLQ